MPFTHGKAAVVYVEDTDLTGYLRSVSTSADVEVADASTFGDEDKAYVTGLGDATLSAEGLLEAGTDGTVAATLGTAVKRIWQVYPAGDAIGMAGRGMSADSAGYEVASEISDVVSFSLEAQSSVGFDRLLSHAEHAQRTASGTATVVDGAVGTNSGAVAYLNVTAISGSAVVVLQDSADNITYADLINFGTVSATGGYRGTVAGTVDRYTRLVHTNAAGTITFVAGLGRQN